MMDDEKSASTTLSEENGRLFHDLPSFTPEQERAEQELVSDEETALAFAEVYGKHNDLPYFTPEQERAEQELLSHEETVLAFADVHGKHPDELEDLQEFEREYDLLLGPGKTELQRGYTARQARQFLAIEGGDAKAAARRMDRYWKIRVHHLGEEAYHNTTPRDTRRIYEMALNAIHDAKADKETRKWALFWVNEWNKQNIEDLDTELTKLVSDGKAEPWEACADLEVAAESPEDQKMLFLLCEDFDHKRAAERMVKYQALRKELFGSEGNSARSVTDDIANSREHACTLEGLQKHRPQEMDLDFISILPGFDDAGRSLICFIPGILHNDPDNSIEGILKVLWYTFHALLENTNVVDNGVVLLAVLKGHDKPKPTLFKFALKIMDFMFQAMPVSIKALHDCAPPAPWFVQLFQPVLKWFLGRKLRSRYCMHAGSNAGILAELNACGISNEQIPIELGGSFDVSASRKKWLEERAAQGL